MENLLFFGKSVKNYPPKYRLGRQIGTKDKEAEITLLKEFCNTSKRNKATKALYTPNITTKQPNSK